MAAATNPFGLTRAYARASHASSLWQLCNTLLLYGLAIALMFASVDVHYAITLLLSLVASVAYLRLFMIGHDCSHESFMPRAWQNRLIGNLMGVLTNTPFRYWARQHALHHRGNGNLDRRGDGDVWLMTVAEYEAALRSNNKAYEVHVYEGANHAFNNDTNEARHHKEAADLAWSRTVAFLKRYLES